MKKCLLFFLVFILCLACTFPVSAAPTVLVDGTQLAFDVPPAIEDGRTLVPLRAIFEALGAEVLWDGKTQTVTALAGDTQIDLTIGQLTAHINNEPYTLDVPAKITDGRTMVPLRFVSEALGAKVQWDGSSQTITITTPNAKTKVVDYEPFVFRNTTWGASVDEVKASEGDLPFQGFENNSLYLLFYYDVRLAGYPCILGYAFTEDRLLSARYVLDSSSLNTGNLLDSYYTLEQMLSDKYGPASFEPVWYDEQYIDSIEKWGYAVRNGDLEVYSYWEYNNTLIEIDMYGLDNEIIWTVYFTDLEFIESI